MCLSERSDSYDFPVCVFVVSLPFFFFLFKNHSTTEVLCAFIMAFLPLLWLSFILSLPIETSDMVTRFISGSTELDIETFIRVPGFSPLLMNYSLTLNSLRFSPEIARWECELSLGEVHYNEGAISLHCVRKAKL